MGPEGEGEDGGMAGADTTIDKGNERGEAEDKVIEPVLEQDALGLVREEDDGCSRVGGAGEEE